MLLSLGIENKSIISCINGFETMDILRSYIVEKGHPICLIYLDINMPIMDGFKTAQEIKKLYKEFKLKVNIIAYSSYSDFETKQRCLLSGMDFYL
jgi:CheY-like chemotaxis protein